MLPYSFYRYTFYQFKILKMTISFKLNIFIFINLHIKIKN
jgi:hypothetical protein